MKNYRVYINNNVLLFAAKIPKSGLKYEILEASQFDFMTVYKGLKKTGKTNIAVLSKKPKESFKDFKKKLTTIKAAGGLVQNVKGEFLFIFRNKKWDLPKGKVEKGENLKTTAVREVEEECGVKIEKRGERLCQTYHIYELDGKLILKRTNWYKMYVKGIPKLVPQKEEGITTASWVGAKSVKGKLKNTYPLIVDVLAAEELIDNSYRN